MGTAVAVFILLYMLANCVAVILLMSTTYGEDVEGFRVKDILLMIIFFPVTLLAFMALLMGCIFEGIVKIYKSKKFESVRNLLNKRVV